MHLPCLFLIAFSTPALSRALATAPTSSALPEHPNRHHHHESKSSDERKQVELGLLATSNSTSSASPTTTSFTTVTGYSTTTYTQSVSSASPSAVTAAAVTAAAVTPGAAQNFTAPRASLGPAWTGTATLVKAGVSGVAAMQVSVVDNDHILIFDKSERNPLQVDGHPAWGAIYEISSQSVRPLTLITNSFCAGGGWLSNGSLVSVGGNPSTFGYDGNGLAAIRIFTPCPDNTCEVFEDPANIHLTSNRWYATTTRLDDGSLMILGGSKYGGYNDQSGGQDNPTLEFFPPKAGKLSVDFQFLIDALYTNLFPLSFLLPDGTLFIAANRLATIYNWRTNTETRLRGIPNGVRINYPASSAAVLLPLTIANNFTPEVLMCGGTTANTDGNPANIDAQRTTASTQCIRMVLNAAGIAGGWTVEQMPTPRVMGDAILTPDGKVLIVNGAQTGVAGYGNVANQVGQSNAGTPNYQAVLYDPLAPAGSRFTSNFPASPIERLYHSSATLLPDGRIWISGSNPNADVSQTKFQTRYDVEILSPPYVSQARPTYSALPTNIFYGTPFTLTARLSRRVSTISAVIMDLGFSTHGNHTNHRQVELHVTRNRRSRVLTLQGPASAGIYPPGYAWLYILADGVPSEGQRVMIGTGANPPSF